MQESYLKPIEERHKSALDGAQLVKCDIDVMTTAVWYGGNTVVFYRLETLEPRMAVSLSDHGVDLEDKRAVEAYIDESFETERERAK